jgi:hypothetical protein
MVYCDHLMLDVWCFSYCNLIGIDTSCWTLYWCTCGMLHFLEPSWTSWSQWLLFFTLQQCFAICSLFLGIQHLNHEYGSLQSIILLVAYLTLALKLPSIRMLYVCFTRAAWRNGISFSISIINIRNECSLVYVNYCALNSHDTWLVRAMGQ